MKMKVIAISYITFLIVVFIKKVKMFELTDIQLLKDFIDSEAKVSIIYCFICWNQYSNGIPTALIKALSKDNNFRISLINLDKNADWKYNFNPDFINLYVLDLECSNSFSFIRNMDINEMFRFPNRWLLINKDASLDIVNYFQPFNFLIDNDIIIATKNEDGYMLHEIFKRRQNQGLVLQDYKFWNRTTGFKVFGETNVVAVRRRDLKKTVINIAVVVTYNATYGLLDSYKDRQFDTINRMNYMVLKNVLEGMNSQKNITFLNNWGFFNPLTGKYNGMMGLLQDDKIEIGGTPLFPEPSRLSILTFVASPARTRGAFVFRKPPLSYVQDLFALPFSQGVWILTIVALVLAGVALYVAVLWEWKIIPEDDSMIIGRLRPNEVSLAALGALCQQGTPTEPRGNAGRTALLTITIVLMALYVSYSANVVALLQSSSDSIQTLTDLLNSRLTLASVDTIFIRYYFESQQDPIRKAIYTKKMKSGAKGHFLPLAEGVERIRQGLFAFHMEVGSGYNIVAKTYQESEKCGLTEIQYVEGFTPWIAVRKKTPYMEMIKIFYKKNHEHGLQMRENRRFFPDRPECSGGSAGFVSVGLSDIRSAFLLILGGMACAIIALVVEHVVAWRIKKIREAETTLYSWK